MIGNLQAQDILQEEQRKLLKDISSHGIDLKQRVVTYPLHLFFFIFLYEIELKVSNRL